MIQGSCYVTQHLVVPDVSQHVFGFLLLVVSVIISWLLLFACRLRMHCPTLPMHCVMASAWQLVVTGSHAAVGPPGVFGLQSGCMLAAHVSVSCHDSP
jgi:hypothetical protein